MNAANHATFDARFDGIPFRDPSLCIAVRRSRLAKEESVRFPLAVLPIIVFTTQGFGQSVPVPSIVGQPFSADQVIVENPRPNVHNVLPTKTIRVYRDSAGRTREDVSIPRDPTATQVVNIEDPVAGVHYYLDTERKTARRLVYPRPPTAGVGPMANTPDAPRKAVMFSSPKFGEVRTTSESLGTQLIEGLTTDGQRVTSVSSVSAPGCDDNVSVIESWYSAELGIILLQKRSNCMGAGTTRLEHINRTEPDPLLFQVPPDYSIIDQAWSGTAAK
jgi:hypothetical protein